MQRRQQKNERVNEDLTQEPRVDGPEVEMASRQAARPPRTFPWAFSSVSDVNSLFTEERQSTEAGIDSHLKAFARVPPTLKSL